MQKIQKTSFPSRKKGWTTKHTNTQPQSQRKRRRVLVLKQQDAISSKCLLCEFCRRRWLQLKGWKSATFSQLGSSSESIPTTVHKEQPAMYFPVEKRTTVSVEMWSSAPLQTFWKGHSWTSSLQTEWGNYEVKPMRNVWPDAVTLFPSNL